MEPSKLQPARIKTLLRMDPVDAFENHLDRFTDDDIEYACIIFPGETLEFAAHKLNRGRFVYCCHRDPRIAVAYLGIGLMTSYLIIV